MKNGLFILILGLTCSFSFAATTTDMKSHWNCTTNASSGDTEAQKKSDEQMKNNRSSVAHAFKQVEKNCRDCTKITCEVE